MSDKINVQERLTNVEDRLARLENLLTRIDEKLEQKPQANVAESESTEKFQQWVTDYVSMRLQQLVPETCDHPDEAASQDGPFLDNTNGTLYGRGCASCQAHSDPVCSGDGCPTRRRECTFRTS